MHTRRALKTCPGGHGFDVQDGRQTPNIETMPIWAFFRCLAGRDVVDRIVNKRQCSAGEEVVDARQASKSCPDGRGFNVRGMERWWTLAEH